MLLSLAKQDLGSIKPLCKFRLSLLPSLYLMTSSYYAYNFSIFQELQGKSAELHHIGSASYVFGPYSQSWDHTLNTSVCTLIRYIGFRLSDADLRKRCNDSSLFLNTKSKCTTLIVEGI
jgi:hypothetical protein